MDVRCEKCQTEYELDESRLKPGGVTVKCTTCGHMFKIRKRASTQSGIPVVRASGGSGPQAVTRASASRATDPLPRNEAPAPRGESRPETRPEPRSDAGTNVRSAVPRALAPDPRGTGPSMPPPAAEGDRTWIIRMENGESRTCRELGTLQQWIITGLVSRESMISRSGKTWKRLGDIAELTNFFTVADEALHARAARDSSRRADYDREEDTRPTNPQLQPDRRTTMGAAQAPAAAPTPSRGVAAPAAARAPAGARADAPAAARTPVAAAPLAAAPTRMPTPPPPAAAPNAPMEARTTGGWAVGGVPPNVDGDVTAEGPRGGAIKAGDSQSFGGLIRPVATDEAMFTSGRNDPVFGNFDEDEVVVPRRRGAGLWIALGALVVTGGAAAAVYFMVLRPRARDDRRAAALIDAAVPSIATGSDGGLAPGPLDAASTAVADLVEDARTQLARDTATALIASGKALADGGGDSASALALRARLLTAQAQIINDEADLAADAATADKIRRDGKQLVLDALTLAQKALKAAPTDPDANLAMADVLRLQGKPAAEVRRYLSSAKGDASAQREATLIGALLDLRDQQAARAKDALTRLDSGDGALEATGDVRPRWRLAMIAGKAQAVVARAAAEAVLAAQPDHAGARALLAKVAAVGTDDPMPPEDGSGSGSGSAGSGPGSGSAAIGPGSGSATRPPPGDGGGGGPPISGGYDGLLAKANKLAEVSCGQAIPYYQKALEAKPNSVEALTGMGFCHLDAKQFSSAHSKFRAALGISPRYERALWGMAEMYQQQGRSDLAIEAYQAYLAVYPRSVAAQRQLDRLQGKTTGTPTPPEPGGGSDPVPTPTPAPPTPETGPDLPQDEPQTTP